MPSFSVQINWKVAGDDLTAVDYADRLRPESERFDPELYERLARPLEAQALHHFSLTIVDSAEARLGNRWLMRRQLQLRYPRDADFADIESRLAREGIFGSIEPDRSGPFSATPNDPIFEPYTSTTAPPQYNRQRWAFDQLNLPDAWDLTRGSATVAIVDSGVWWDKANQRFHPELDRKLLRLSSGPGTNRAAAWLPVATGDVTGVGSVVNEPVTGPHFAGHGTHVAALVAAQTDNARGGAGGCPGCFAAIVPFGGSFKAPNRVTDPSLRGVLDGALPFVWRTGAQVVNRSGSSNGEASNCVRLSD